MENNTESAWKRFIPPVLAVLVGIGMFASLFAFEFFRTYISSVLAHWVALMSGGVSVVVSFYKEIRKSAGKYVLYVVAAMCVFFAGFQAWQDQYHAVGAVREKLGATERQLASLSQPQLHAVLDLVVSAPSGAHGENCLITVHATITNKGAPSIAEIGNISVKTPSGKIVDGNTLLPPTPTGKIILHIVPTSSPYYLEFTFADWLPEKAIRQPIPTGGAVHGYLQALITGISRTQLGQPGMLVLLGFKDVNGKEYSAEPCPGPMNNPPDLRELERQSEVKPKP